MNNRVCVLLPVCFKSFFAVNQLSDAVRVNQNSKAEDRATENMSSDSP